MSVAQIEKELVALAIFYVPLLLLLLLSLLLLFLLLGLLLLQFPLRLLANSALRDSRGKGGRDRLFRL